MVDTMEQSFREEMLKRKSSDTRSLLMTKHEYFLLLEEVKVASDTAKKSNRQYYILGRYEILQCGDVEKLIRKQSEGSQELVYFTHIDDMFDIIKRAHVACGHGGRDKMTKALNKYANVTRDSIELYKSLCVQCQQKRKRATTKGVVVKPILSKDFGSRAQIDLIDMQSMCKVSYRWIMVYQDHLTKYCVLRPLTSKRAAEVAWQLVDIFLLLGAPQILQSDNGSEFTASVITELKVMWPDLLMVHGKPRHPESQGSVERLNCDVKDILTAWLGDNDSTDWPTGLRFVQFQKNSGYHSGIKQSPFKALFGRDAQVGLRSASLPSEILERLVSEDDLMAAYQQSDPSQVSSGNQTPVSPNLPTQEDTSPDPSEATSSTSSSAPSSQVTAIQIRHDNIQLNRKRAADGQLAQAERMLKRSRLEQVAGNPGDNVIIPIPLVDRGRGDPRNIMGVVLERNENDMYRIAVRAGILKGSYSRNQFDLCPHPLYSVNDFSTDKEIGLRQAVQQGSKCGGQGFAKCNCTQSGKQCKSNKCKCFKAGLKCNSKCHATMTCPNKI